MNISEVIQSEEKWKKWDKHTLYLTRKKKWAKLAKFYLELNFDKFCNYKTEKLMKIY